MLVEHLRVEADALLRSKGIHVASDGVDLTGDFLGAAVLRAFEDHVLDEMRDAIPLGSLISRSGFQPDPYRSRADMLHLLSNDGQPVGQFLTTNIADFLDHCCLLFCTALGCLKRG